MHLLNKIILVLIGLSACHAIKKTETSFLQGGKNQTVSSTDIVLINNIHYDAGSTTHTAELSFQQRHWVLGLAYMGLPAWIGVIPAFAAPIVAYYTWLWSQKSDDDPTVDYISYGQDNWDTPIFALQTNGITYTTSSINKQSTGGQITTVNIPFTNLNYLTISASGANNAKSCLTMVTFSPETNSKYGIFNNVLTIDLIVVHEIMQCFFPSVNVGFAKDSNNSEKCFSMGFNKGDIQSIKFDLRVANKCDFPTPQHHNQLTDVYKGYGRCIAASVSSICWNNFDGKLQCSTRGAQLPDLKIIVKN
jgi:hypothetical protein